MVVLRIGEQEKTKVSRNILAVEQIMTHHGFISRCFHDNGGHNLPTKLSKNPIYMYIILKNMAYL